MSDILFACDLDNTLLYSHKVALPEEKICAEYYLGHEQSFLTRRTVELLKKVRKKTIFVPITTRSLEQYRRIIWPQGLEPKSALAANGAIMLEGGEPEPIWQEESRQKFSRYTEVLEDLRQRIIKDYPEINCRMVDGSYLFLAAADSSSAERLAAQIAAPSSVSVEVSGRKIYFLPPELDKGATLRRLQKLLNPSTTFAAGDSSLDVPMLNSADLAFFLGERLPPKIEAHSALCIDDFPGSEKLLEEILKRLTKF